ncbi:MAG TPA: hypothetical protein VFB33_11730 [Candidatus Binataceae bacterium]|jgi:hypothetical protein|nr:hypothetical protein [Candidatus Binataceae bacterium]
MLLENPKGNFSFVRGYGPPFSAAAVAAAGFDLIHATFAPLARMADGFAAMERHLRDARRPFNAVCGIELRIPAPLTPAGFDEFNRGYIERLSAWGVHVDAANPVARTNVALEVNPVAEPSIYGFYYTAPAVGAGRPGFVLAGVPEIASRQGGKREIVAAGDVSADGMRRKTACVLEVLASALNEIDRHWDDATTVNLYTVRDAYPLLAQTLLPALGGASRRGLRWHYARPPVVGLELEIDGCAARRELVLTA